MVENEHRRATPAKLQSSPAIITVINADAHEPRSGETGIQCSCSHLSCPSTITATRPRVSDGHTKQTCILTDFRYATPSPATCPFCELNSPFFLNTKLDPIRHPLATANRIPTVCAHDFKERSKGHLGMDNVEKMADFQARRESNGRCRTARRGGSSR